MWIINFINKDVSEINESKRVMVTLRVLCLIVLSAFALDTFFAGLGAVIAFPLAFISFYSMFAALFVSTYYFKTKIVLRLFLLLMTVWIFHMIPVLGWTSGIQNYCIIILMLVFFASFSNSSVKFAYAFSVLIFRFMLIALFGGIKSSVPISAYADKAMQVTNITAVFVSIIFISHVFSKKEIEAEKKLMKYNDLLKEEANTDPLTGLHNRRRAVEFIKELTDGNRDNVSVAIGDIDFFKKVNDTYGHSTGDEVLKFIAKEMTETCNDAFIARWGGEEFIIIFPGLNGDEAYVRLDGLHSKIRNTPITVGDININITMTFGLSELPYDNDAEAAINEADEKLYMGKANGRNQVVY